MNTAAYVDQKIAEIKLSGKPLSDQAWEAALLCVGWPYIFGDRGEYCTPSHRRSRYNSVSPGKNKDNIKDKCKNFEGTGSCSGCKWLPNGQKVRAYDCRGFTYWVLLQFGIKIMGAGATTQWNNADNWAAKGTIDSIPEDKLVCLFYPEKNDPKKMAHTGFGYNGQTVECSNGVQHFTKRDKKWTHWAIPKGLYDGGEIVTPVQPSTDTAVKLPTLRKGSRGSYVTLLQTLLLNRGYQLPKYGADGDFGNETLAAVKQFQQDWGLTVDGIVGTKTWETLESSPERQKLYTVTIPHLTKEQAEEVLKPYTGTMTLEV